MNNSPAPSWSAPSSVCQRCDLAERLQVAQDTEAKAKVDVKTTAEKLRVLGNPNLEQPTGFVEIRAPDFRCHHGSADYQCGGIAGLGSPILSLFPI